MRPTVGICRRKRDRRLAQHQGHRCIISDASILGVQSEATLCTFMLAMTLHPQVQAQARAELDSVSSNSLPSADMFDRTPYLNAILLETLRWQPPAPIGKSRYFGHELWAALSYMPFRGPARLLQGRYLRWAFHTFRNHSDCECMVRNWRFSLPARLTLTAGEYSTTKSTFLIQPPFVRSAGLTQLESLSSMLKVALRTPTRSLSVTVGAPVPVYLSLRPIFG